MRRRQSENWHLKENNISEINKKKAGPVRNKDKSLANTMAYWKYHGEKISQ